MLPDTAAGLLLFEAVEFPLVWKKSKYLLAQRIVDASIIYFNDLWWIFGRYLLLYGLV